MINTFYKICKSGKRPEMQGLWDGDVWRDVLPLSVECFRPEGSDHRPRTQCKLLYDEQTLFGIFRVEDQYVRSVHTGFQSDVWKDSCVELFIQPKDSPGYFNFEFNCGGALLASYVTSPVRIDGSLQGLTPLAPEEDLQIRRYASLTKIVEPEIEEPLTWLLEFALPFPFCKIMQARRETSKDKSGVPMSTNAAMKHPTPTGRPGRRWSHETFTPRKASEN